MEKPPVKMNARPRHTVINASVTMNGGTRRRVIMRPGEATRGHADANAHNDGQQRPQTRLLSHLLQDTCRNHSGKSDDGSDRKVYASREDDQRHANCENAVDRDLQRDVDKVIDGEKAG